MRKSAVPLRGDRVTITVALGIWMKPRFKVLCSLENSNSIRQA